MLLHYRAGPRALALLRERGLDAGTLAALIAPAAGPKWLAVAGLDRALIESDMLLSGAGQRTLLLGASAGAWRSMALCARDPARTHRALAEGYIAQRFTRDVTPRVVSDAYVRLLAEVFPDADVQHALEHRRLELAMLAVRTRATTGSGVYPLQAAALGLAAALNALSPRTRGLFFERTLFTREQGSHPMLPQLQGARAPLRLDNARDALLASGTVPLYMAPVRDIAGARSGRYMDGGLTDYHVAQPITTGGEGVALLLLHQARIVPNWFDKSLPYRRARADWLQDLLLVYPSDAWVAALPGGHVPTREDFETFVDAPEQRIARWTEGVARSEQLGEQLLDDLRRGRLPELVEPL